MPGVRTGQLSEAAGIPECSMTSLWCELRNCQSLASDLIRNRRWDLSDSSESSSNITEKKQRECPPEACFSLFGKREVISRPAASLYLQQPFHSLVSDFPLTALPPSSLNLLLADPACLFDSASGQGKKGQGIIPFTLASSRETTSQFIQLSVDQSLRLLMMHV